MLHRLLLACIIISLLISPVPRTQAADFTTNPYIYYFSDKINAFIIERADGTDTRVLGRGIMPPGVDRVDGPGWSPSGKWFAWTAEKYTNDSGYASWSSNYLISANGEHRVTLIERFQMSHMAWASGRDLLLIAPAYKEVIEKEGVQQLVSLYDPETNKLYTLEEGVLGNGIRADWNEENYVIEHQKLTTETEFIVGKPNDFQTRKTFHGVITQRNDLTNEGVYFEDYVGYSTSSTSSTGNIAYIEDNMLLVENLFTGEHHSFQKPNEDDLILRWSPDGQYAFLFGRQMYFLSLKTNYIFYIDTPKLPEYGSACPQSTWSSDSKNALFEVENVTYRLTTSTEKLEIISVPRLDDCLGWYFQNDRQMLFWTQNYRTGLISAYLYDLDNAAGAIIRVDNDGQENGTSSLQVKLSVDMQHLIYIADGPVLYNLRTKQRQLLPPAAGSYFSSTGGEAIWHSGGDWALTFDAGLVAGGGYCCRHLGIVRSDGMHQRDLSFVQGYVSPIELGWLPSQVNLSMLPSAEEKPLFPSPTKTLEGKDWTFAIAWKPDGKELLSSGDGWLNSMEDVTRWDLVSGQGTVAFSASGKQYIGWTKDDNGTYAPAPVSRLNVSGWEPGDLLAVSPDGKRVVTRGYPFFSGVYDATTRELIAAIIDGSIGCYSASFSPDGRYLAVGNPYFRTSIIDTRTWQHLFTFPDPTPAVAFSPDGQYIATSSSWNIQIWRVADLIPPQTP